MPPAKKAPAAKAAAAEKVRESEQVVEVRMRSDVRVTEAAGRQFLVAGKVYALPSTHAKALLESGDAEAVASAPSKRAERRPAANRGEVR